MDTNLYAYPHVLHENMEAPRAYYMPMDADENSEMTSLNGKWDFNYYDSIAEVPDLPDEIVFQNQIEVPGCWECAGYGQKQYLNVNYPIPFAPPFIPRINPVGVYRTCFETDTDKMTYIVFEGVSSCMMLYVNGTYVGISKGSHLQAEFDITKYVKAGQNVLHAIVFTWSSGTYLEDQDAYRYHGIFRDVYLLSRPHEHIRDFFIHADMNGDFSVDIDCVGNPEVTVQLIDPTGEEEIEVSGNSVHVNDPMLWNAEEPNLYTAILQTEDEVIQVNFGFRSVSISKDRELLVNGKPIKLRGVNRHESNPLTGWTVTRQNMEQDIFLMKQGNVNALRTSHYPDHPYLYQLCDEYGLYVVDECDIETHGADAAYPGQPEKAIASLSGNPDWCDAYVSRMKRTVGRDKNFPCIIMWSLGNESQFGENHRAMAKWVHETDPSRPVHYERTAYPDPSYGKDQCPIDPCVDIVSRMYPDLEGVEYQGAESDDPRPYFMCEYAHAMGNGPGGFEDYWKLIYRYPRLIGGCVWEWCDHSVYLHDSEGKTLGFGYGGDSGEFPHDGNFCVDGLVMPNRIPSPGYLSMKAAYRPADIEVVDLQAGKFKVTSRLDFVNLSEMDLAWYVMKDGKAGPEHLEKISVEPHESVEISLPVSSELGTPVLLGQVVIELRTDLDLPWSLSGDVLSKYTFTYFEGEPVVQGTPVVLPSYGSRYEVVACGSAEYTIDTLTGMLCSVVEDGAEFLEGPSELTIWRAMTDNERRIKENFHMAHMQKAKYFVTGMSRADNRLTFDGFIGAAARVPFVYAQITYTFSTGGVTVHIDAKRNPEFKVDIIPEEHDLLQTPTMYLPRFGMRIRLKKNFEKLKYLAYGPDECYIDSCNHAHLGIYESTVSDEYFPYIMPQDCGNHIGARLLCIENKKRQMKITGKNFEFSALHQTIEGLDNAKHTWEIPDENCTELLICYKNSGVGSNSCGPALDKRYALIEPEFSYSFHISVGMAGN